MSLPPLYAIVDQDLAERVGLTPVALAEAYLRAGVRWLQLRAKRATSADLLTWAEHIATRARANGALFVVNDRADVARLVGAGVHVGQEDLPPARVRALVGADALVGWSTHTVDQLDEAAREPVSYVAIGPVFGTTTKATGYDAVGLGMVEAAVRRLAGVPVVAIGGITLERAPEVLAAGATAVAVISDLVSPGDPESRAREWVAALSRGAHPGASGGSPCGVRGGASPREPADPSGIMPELFDTPRQ